MKRIVTAIDTTTIDTTTIDTTTIDTTTIDANAPQANVTGHIRPLLQQKVLVCSAALSSACNDFRHYTAILEDLNNLTKIEKDKAKAEKEKAVATMIREYASFTMEQCISMTNALCDTASMEKGDAQRKRLQRQRDALRKIMAAQFPLYDFLVTKGAHGGDVYPERIGDEYDREANSLIQGYEKLRTYFELPKLSRIDVAACLRKGHTTEEFNVKIEESTAKPKINSVDLLSSIASRIKGIEERKQAQG